MVGNWWYLAREQRIDHIFPINSLLSYEDTEKIYMKS